MTAIASGMARPPLQENRLDSRSELLKSESLCSFRSCCLTQCTGRFLRGCAAGAENNCEHQKQFRSHWRRYSHSLKSLAIRALAPVYQQTERAGNRDRLWLRLLGCRSGSGSEIGRVDVELVRFGIKGHVARAKFRGDG